MLQLLYSKAAGTLRVPWPRADGTRSVPATLLSVQDGRHVHPRTQPALGVLQVHLNAQRPHAGVQRPGRPLYLAGVLLLVQDSHADGRLHADLDQVGLRLRHVDVDPHRVDAGHDEGRLALDAPHARLEEVAGVDVPAGDDAREGGADVLVADQG